MLNMTMTTKQNIEQSKLNEQCMYAAKKVALH